ncbi:MAG: hypothetical protein QM656_17875, partial [Paracoccaceae bacterium]
LLAPARHDPALPGASSLEGRGTMTLAAAVRALSALVPSRRMGGPPVPPRAGRLGMGLSRLACDCGLPAAAAAKAGHVAHLLTEDLLRAPLPWPNRAVSSLAQGQPVELSAGLGRAGGAMIRFTCDAGDPRLGGAARVASAMAALARAAAALDLGHWGTVAGALHRLELAAQGADPAERFFLWSGLDLAGGGDGPILPVLKAYANLGLAGRDRAARCGLAAEMLTALGARPAEAARWIGGLDAVMQGHGMPQQMALAAHPRGVAAKLYWELPAHDPVALAALRLRLGLKDDPRFSPVIPDLATAGDASRCASGLAVRIDPAAGPLPDLTLATAATQRIRWRGHHEDAQIAGWAASLSLDAGPALRLAQALRHAGPAVRSLHTLTLRPQGLSAAVYFRPDGWLARQIDTPAPPFHATHSTLQKGVENAQGSQRPFPRRAPV